MEQEAVVAPSVPDRDRSLAGLGARALKLFRTQRDFNEVVKGVQTDKPSWMEVYMLGLVGEVDEILREVRWKYHRPGRASRVNRVNLAMELADATKYLLSAWQEAGFNLDEILYYTQLKSEQVEQAFRRDWFPPAGRRVIVCDLDGTTANYREGYRQWAGMTTDHVKTLAVDLDNGIPWHEYERAKTTFEVEGGYGKLPVYNDTRDLLQGESARGTYIFIITARPAGELQGVQADTFEWLAQHRIPHDAVLFGRDERLVKLLELSKGNNQLVLLDDDPALALRAAEAGFTVMLRDQPYNETTVHRNIVHYKTYPTKVPWGMVAEVAHA